MGAKVQHYRNGTVTVQTLSQVKESIQNNISNYADGELVLARYKETSNGPIKTVGGLVYKTSSTQGAVTFLTEDTTYPKLSSSDHAINKSYVVKGIGPDVDTTKFLCSDGSWATPSGTGGDGSGTVTGVQIDTFAVQNPDESGVVHLPKPKIYVGNIPNAGYFTCPMATDGSITIPKPNVVINGLNNYMDTNGTINIQSVVRKISIGGVQHAPLNGSNGIVYLNQIPSYYYPFQTTNFAISGSNLNVVITNTHRQYTDVYLTGNDISQQNSSLTLNIIYDTNQVRNNTWSDRKEHYILVRNIDCNTPISISSINIVSGTSTDITKADTSYVCQVYYPDDISSISLNNGEAMEISVVYIDYAISDSKNKTMSPTFIVTVGSTYNQHIFPVKNN